MDLHEMNSLDGDEPFVRNQLRDLVECTICLETYTDPVALPCQHTFCRQCLQDIWSRGSQKRTVPCPMCRKEITVPKDGLTAFEKDFKMNKLIEIYQSESLSDTPMITHFCCVHRTKALDVYCFDCSEVTCTSCFLGLHSGHRGSDVKGSADEVKKQLDHEIDLLSTCVVKSLDRQTRQRAEMFRFFDDVTKIEAEINTHSEMLKQTIDSHKNKLLESLSKRRKSVQLEMEKMDRSLDDCVAATELFKTHCCQMKMETGESIEDICWDMKKIRLKSLELQQKCNHQNLSTNEELTLSFKPTDLRTTSQGDNIVGKIETVPSTATENIADSPAEGRDNLIDFTPIAEINNTPVNSVSTSPDTSFEVAETVWSVSMLNNWICVLQRNPTSIQLHKDTAPFPIEHELRTPLIVNPWNMRSSHVSNCLYITDRDSKCVWKIFSTDRPITKWLSGLEDPFRLSVTKDGLVIIPRWRNSPSLSLFQPDATTIDRVSLPANVIEPRDVIMMSSGDLVISHRWSDAKTWGVTRLTRKGHVVRRFNQSLQLSFPSELSVDSDGRVFVADFNNDRVVVLDEELNWKETIMTRQEDFVGKPRSLCSGSNQVIIAYNGKIRIVRLDINTI